MEFNPSNPIVKLCLQGMALEDQGKPEEAAKFFIQAWTESTNNFEKFLASHYVSRHQMNVQDRLEWLKKSLDLSKKIESQLVRSALPALYTSIAQCYEELAKELTENPFDKGPFYHGTRAALNVGDLLIAG